MKKLYAGIAIYILLFAQHATTFQADETPKNTTSEVKKPETKKSTPPISTTEKLATIPLAYAIYNGDYLAHELGHFIIGHIGHHIFKLKDYPITIDFETNKFGLITRAFCRSTYNEPRTVKYVPEMIAGPIAGVAFTLGSLYALNTYQEYRKNEKTLKEAHILAKKSNPLHSNYNFLLTGLCFHEITNTVLNLIPGYDCTTDGTNIFNALNLKIPNNKAMLMCSSIAALGTMGYLGNKLYTLYQNSSGIFNAEPVPADKKS